MLPQTGLSFAAEGHLVALSDSLNWRLFAASALAALHKTLATKPANDVQQPITVGRSCLSVTHRLGSAKPWPSTHAHFDHFLTCRPLQADYAELQQKYADLKEKKIQDLDSMLEEHAAKQAAHNETAVKLADHWRQEAHRQAAFAQAAGAPAMQVCFLLLRPRSVSLASHKNLTI